MDYFGVYDNDAVCNSLQLWSGAFVIRKSAVTVKLINDWVEANWRKKELVTDKSSAKRNKVGFVEHRHDQSSFSLLVKQLPHVEISYKETQLVHAENPNDWSVLADFPIQARRHKLDGRPLSEVLKNKLLRPWRMILNFYFRKIRNYEFVGRSYPW